ncbi:LytTR family DNA-binding domain-containing protein [Methylocapsa sp. S129]|uniref:LytTR family DNA-binding domain-containing protein n=1 Tax=Methylocapsa sp. S129 TaxID=1641869 RepID=UPI00131B4B69|nr:LytTR family DNA-binding domain-containing protein [Methylocapsa sp. S129]
MHPMGDVWQWLGMSGDALGTSGVARRTLLYCYAVAVAMVGAINAINVITTHHEQPQYGLAAPILWEGSSGLAFILFLWIPWVACRIAPLRVRPRWKLLIHVPAMLIFSLAHVTGFIGLRKLVYWFGGAHYEFGAFLPHFGYELAKDAISYAIFAAAAALVEHLLRQLSLIETPGQTLTFDIRDGSRLTRVRLDQVLAIASAGNYVEFVLKDQRKLLMRSPLSTLESELGPRGFLRTHRSWLVNAGQMTALKPEGSGDYTVELGSVTAPLSRRFPAALAKLRGGCGS